MNSNINPTRKDIFTKYRLKKQWNTASFNPLTPMSDQDRISPNNNNNKKNKKNKKKKNKKQKKNKKKKKNNNNNDHNHNHNHQYVSGTAYI